MYNIDVTKLNGKIIEMETTKEALADEIGIDRGTFYCRLKNGKFLIGDMHKICDVLKLSNSEAKEIFLFRNLL